MCHSCVSRNPDCFVPAAVFLDRKQGPGTMDSLSILGNILAE